MAINPFARRPGSISQVGRTPLRGDRAEHAAPPLDEGEGHRVPEAYGVNYDRLVALKAKFDPTNFLRCNRTFHPTAAENACRHERWRMVRGIDNIGICTTDLTRSV